MDRLRNTFADDLTKLIQVHELHLDANNEALDNAIMAMITHAALGMQYRAGLFGPETNADVAIAMFRAGTVAIEEKRQAAERDRDGGAA